MKSLDLDRELRMQLSWITSGELMKVFLSPMHHKGMINIPTPTLGGNMQWDTLWETDGWKVQKCRVLKNLLPHYRILDPDNVRRAWYISPQQINRDVTLFANILRQKLVMEDTHYGIVFSGGGGKGAYQIGVWKYLHEIGIDRKITGVSGASVGALNSLLFVQGDYEKARDVWLNIQQDDLTHVSLLHYLTQLVSILQSFQAGLTALNVLANPFLAALNLAGSVLSNVAPATLAAIVAKNMQLFMMGPEKSTEVSFSLFSQKRLEQIIEENVDKDKVQKNLKGKSVYSMLCDLNAGPYPCCWNKRPFEDIRDMVLTSAAMPGAYSKRTFDGRVCIDGGMVDNIPVAPLAKDFHNIIVIHLLPYNNAKEEADWKKSSQGISLQDTRFYHVYPSREQHMSTLKDTLTVNPELTKYRMELGYEDAKAQLQALVEHDRYEKPVPKYAQPVEVLSFVRALW